MKPRPSSWMTLLLLSLLCFPCATGCDRGDKQDHYAPGLGEIMTLIQMRHAKLWLAGQAKNWPLASYEVKEIVEGLTDAVGLHPNHPGSPVSIAEVTPTMMDGPLRDLKHAIEDENPESFSIAFDVLTHACNSCHQVTAFSFNVVTKPTGDYFANQDFDLPARQGK